MSAPEITVGAGQTGTVVGVVPRTERLAAIDLLRGMAMILMAIDHSMSLAGVPPVAESYNGVYPALGLLPYTLIGLATNIASSIFFMLAGTSMAFFEASRLRRGWTNRRISQFFVTRAAILVFLDMLIEPIDWKSPSSFDALSAIAFGIIVLTLVRHLPLRTLALSALALFLVYPILVTTIPIQENTPLGYVLIILLRHHVDTPPLVEFPALARLSLILGGYVWGVMLRENRFQRWHQLVWIGMAGLGVTLVLRLLEGYGNFLPYRPDLPLIYFFIENKQPPSLVFLLFNLSLGVLLLAWINNHRPLLTRFMISPVLILFGQTSLFFYFTHLLLYSQVVSHLFDIHLIPIALLTLFLEFALGIAIMIPLCAGYRWLRQRYPDSILQYL